MPRPPRRSSCGSCSASTVTGSATSWTPSPPKARPAARSGTGYSPTQSWRACCSCTTCIRSTWTPDPARARPRPALPGIACRRGQVSRRRPGRGGAAAPRGQLPRLPLVHGDRAADNPGSGEDAAPEVTKVVVEGMTDPPEPPLLQIGRRTGPPDSPGSPVSGTGDPGWVSLPGIGPPDGRPTATTAGGIPVVVCSVRGTLYAYHDACAACGSSLA